MSDSSSPLNSSRNRASIWTVVSAVCLVLVVTLILTNMLYAGLAGQQTLLEGRASEVLYVSAFDEFADEWDLYEGQQSAQFVDGQLELKVSAAQTATWSTARPLFADFDIGVSASATDGPIDNAFGIVFHVQEANDVFCNLSAVILCGIEDLSPLAGAAIRQYLGTSAANDYYAFLVSSDGYYSLWRSEAGATKLLSAWIPSPSINQGLEVSNRIRAVGIGSSYQFLINGTQVKLCIPTDQTAASTYAGGECIDGSMQAEYHAPSHSTGKLGVIAQSTATGGGGLTLRFDNFIVLSPSADANKDVKL